METQKFPRMRLWPIGIGFFCFILGFLCVALWAMSGGFTEWKLPFWQMEPGMGFFLFCFLVVWFSIPIWGLCHLSAAFQRIHLDREELRVCVGPIVLRRIPCRRIKTVVRTGDSPNYAGRYTEPYQLFLCADDPETLLGDLSTQQLKKRLAKGRIPGTLKMDWSPKLEQGLRQYLPGAEFIL